MKNDTRSGIFCKECGTRLTIDTKICPGCGRNVDLFGKQDSNKKVDTNKSKGSNSETICEACGAKMAIGSRFCSNCGKSIVPKTSVCKRCGQPLKSNMNFCSSCGYSVKQLDKTSSASPSSHNSSNGMHTQFVQAKCSNCGAHLLLDNTQKTASCPSCGTPYIISTLPYSNTTPNHESDFVIVNGELVEYKGISKDIVIPNCVSAIGEGVFLGEDITSVSIPDSVSVIKEYAFKDCKLLKKVRIPPSMVEIDSSAFQGDKDLNIVWPETWKSKHLVKLHIVAHTENVESLVMVPSTDRHYGATPHFYCGREITGNYMFSQRDLFLREHTKNCSVFDYFEIVSLDIVQMYKELASLFDRAGIPRSLIGTTEVPYYNSKTKIVNRGNAKRGMVQVLEIQLCDDE